MSEMSEDQNSEEERFGHLKEELQVRIGGVGFGKMSDNDEEDKKDKAKKKNGNNDKSKEKFKQTKLIFGGHDSKD